MSQTPATIDPSVLARLVVGDPSDRSVPLSEHAWIDAAEWHGVAPLIAERLTQFSGTERGPAGDALTARSALKRLLAESAIRSALQERELNVVIDALANNDIPVLLMKGAALAHSIYGAPHLRPRFDTDLLIAPDAVEAASRIFVELGYRTSRQSAGDVFLQQADFEKRDAQGVWHVYDVHWKIANPQAFALMPGFDALLLNSVCMPSLAAHARRPNDAAMLLIACVHQVAHHGPQPRLIWSYDIHLLLERLDSGGIREFTRLAGAARVSAVCAHALTVADRLFPSRLPRGVVEDLAEQSRVAREPSRRFVEGQTQLGVLLSDLKLLGRWRDRVRLIRQHVFPPPAYMFQLYNVESAAWLPALYTHRAVTGMRKWVRK